MRIFLSWSGDKSHDMAKAFGEWLPTVLYSAKPWISSADIDKGGTWLTSIKEALHQSDGIGIFFVTRDAMTSPWLLFEAGSVASLGHQRVCVVYVDIETSEVQPPLSLFQGTKLSEEDVFALVKSLNKSLPTPMEEPILAKTFERGWPELQRSIASILSADRTSKKPKRLSSDQVLADIAEATQRIEARLSNLERRTVTEARSRAMLAADAVEVTEQDLPTRRVGTAALRYRRQKFFGQFSRTDFPEYLASLSPAEREALCAELGYGTVEALVRGQMFSEFARRQLEAAGRPDDEDKAPE